MTTITTCETSNTRARRTVLMTLATCLGGLALAVGATHRAAAAASEDHGTGGMGTLADHEMWTNDQSWPYDPAGHMWFNEYGDVVTLCDNDADGQRVYLTVNASGDAYSMSVGGEGNCVTRKAAHGGKYNLPENRYIRFEISASGDPVGSLAWAEWHNDN